MISKEQLIKGIADFIETEMLTALSGWQLWIGSAALNLAKIKSDRFIEPYLKYAEALGAVNESGMIDIDTIYNAFKQSKVKLEPFKLEIGSNIFTISFKDIENLYGKLKNPNSQNLQGYNQ